MIEPGKYRHYKGNDYEVIGVGLHTETLEELVLYRALYGEGKLWARPASMWNETVVVDGKEMKRFTKIWKKYYLSATAIFVDNNKNA